MSRSGYSCIAAGLLLGAAAIGCQQAPEPAADSTEKRIELADKPFSYTEIPFTSLIVFR